MQIRSDTVTYMQELKAWLAETRDVPLEEMSQFFAARVADYEAHMQQWQAAYRQLADALPAQCTSLLDISCGTGLELDEIWKRFPEMQVTGIDLSASMLARLRQKHADKPMQLLQGDYFQADLGQAQFDAAVSFQTLHHFSKTQKVGLFRKILHALKPGGVYLECDYIACCLDEEALLQQENIRRRQAANIQEEQFVHFDTPLTAAHESEAMQEAGFVLTDMRALDCGVVMFCAEKD